LLQEIAAKKKAFVDKGGGKIRVSSIGTSGGVQKCLTNANARQREGKGEKMFQRRGPGRRPRGLTKDYLKRASL